MPGRSAAGSYPEWCREDVATLRHEAGLMDEAVRRLRALGIYHNFPVEKLFNSDMSRENPLPSARELA